MRRRRYVAIVALLAAGCAEEGDDGGDTATTGDPGADTTSPTTTRDGTPTPTDAGGTTAGGTPTQTQPTETSTPGETSTATETATETPTATETETPTATETETATETPTSTPTATATPSPNSFEGSGQEVVDDVSLDGGLVLVEGTHDGSSNFIVELVPEEGIGDPVINAIGGYDGVVAALPSEGTYQIDVTADGSWTLTVSQPRPSSGDSLPQSYEGDGPTVVGPVSFDGNHSATGTHDGESNFIVELYPPTGQFQTVVFNEIGGVDGAETTFNHGGVGFVAVRADGTWSLELE